MSETLWTPPEEETASPPPSIPIQTVEGYEPDGLQPLDATLYALVPLNAGDRVAFPDITDPEHPENDHTHAGKYGIVKAIGFADGGIRLDLLVFDPALGVTEQDTTIHRASLGEVQ